MTNRSTHVLRTRRVMQSDYIIKKLKQYHAQLYLFL